MLQSSALVPLVVERAAQVGALLARAFHRDPLYARVLPEEGRRAQLLAWIFERVVRYALLYGRAYTTLGLEGAVCWLPPWQTELGIGRLVRSGLYATPLKMGLSAYRRFAPYIGCADALHKRHAPEPHWYLWVMGVDPPHQGRGIGSRLISPILAQADGAGMACYLETDAPDNLTFYQKHGFRVVGEARVPKLDVPLWAMRREAVRG